MSVKDRRIGSGSRDGATYIMKNQLRGYGKDSACPLPARQPFREFVALLNAKERNGKCRKVGTGLRRRIALEPKIHNAEGCLPL
jgi:hypothetical protein